jgi:hypothetical protein
MEFRFPTVYDAFYADSRIKKTKLFNKARLEGFKLGKASTSTYTVESKYNDDFKGSIYSGFNTQVDTSDFFSNKGYSKLTIDDKEINLFTGQKNAVYALRALKDVGYGESLTVYGEGNKGNTKEYIISKNKTENDQRMKKDTLLFK